MDIFDMLLAPYREYTPLQTGLELTGAVFGVASVVFSIRKNIWVYPTGIISTLIYVYLLFNAGLLGDMLINVYYTVMSVYGLILWNRNRTDEVHVEVLRMTRRDYRTGLLLFIFSMAFVTIVYYYKPLLDHWLNPAAEVVSVGLGHLTWANWLDVFTTSIFLVGMWLMAKRKAENWICWIVGDLICVPMFFYKELHITAIQYIFFTIMAFYGYRAWLRSTENTATA